MGLKDMYLAFKSLDMEQAGRNAIEQTRSQAVQLNKEQLYYEGIKSNGDDLRPYSSRQYSILKAEMNPFIGFGRADLFLTGAFQGHMFAEVKGDKLEFGSTDRKTPFLEGRDGKDIFGLTKENTNNYAVDVVRPKIVSYVEQVTGLKAT